MKLLQPDDEGHSAPLHTSRIRHRQGDVSHARLLFALLLLLLIVLLVAQVHHALQQRGPT